MLSQLARPQPGVEAPEATTSDRWQWPLLLAILVVAAVVRLWGLGSQPILYFDSGAYLGEGAFLASAARHALAAALSSQPGDLLQNVAAATATGVDAHSPDLAKPGHAILLAIAFLLLGNTALAGALVSAISGLATVAVTYFVGLRAWGPRVALAAAALLAISGQHLVYSREPLVEADGLLFSMLASLVYLRARGSRGLFGAGVLWGLAFSCNNRLSYVPALFVIAELAEWPGWIGLIRRGVMVGLGCLTPLVVIEGAYLLARQIGRLAAIPTDWLDYAQQFVTFTRMNPPDRLRFDEWPTYFVDVGLMEGLPILALLLIGIVLVALRVRSPSRSRADLLLAGSLLIPLVLYSVYSTGEVRLRHFSLALPWAMLAAGLALDWLAAVVLRLVPKLRERGVTRGGVLALGASVLMLLALPRIVALDAAPSGMEAVVGYLGATGPVASTNGPVLSFYVGEARTNARLREAFINVPSDLDVLAAQYPTLVVDMQASVFAGDLTNIYDRTTPRLAVPNGSDAWYLADLLEHYGIAWGKWDDLLATWNANRADATQLRVYAMADVLAARNAE